LNQRKHFALLGFGRILKLKLHLLGCISLMLPRADGFKQPNGVFVSLPVSIKKIIEHRCFQIEPHDFTSTSILLYPWQKIKPNVFHFFGKSP